MPEVSQTGMTLPYHDLYLYLFPLKRMTNGDSSLWVLNWDIIIDSRCSVVVVIITYPLGIWWKRI